MGRNIVQGSVVNVNSESFRVVKTFQPKTEEEPVFMNPHDIIVSPNGTSLYVAELNPFRVWKFRIGTYEFHHPVYIQIHVPAIFEHFNEYRVDYCCT